MTKIKIEPCPLPGVEKGYSEGNRGEFVWCFGVIVILRVSKIWVRGDPRNKMQVRAQNLNAHTISIGLYEITKEVRPCHSAGITRLTVTGSVREISLD